MMAVLFLIGQGKEQAQLLADLLRPERIAGKPNYLMASEEGLVLYECIYDKLTFTHDADNALANYEAFIALLSQQLL